MASTNTYPEGSWIIFAVVFVIFGYQFVWRKLKIKSFFSGKWIICEDNFSFDYINDALIQFSNISDYGFSIIKHATILLENNKIPVIFGYVDHPQAKPQGLSRHHTKTFFTFSDIATMRFFLERHPRIFEEVCETEKYRVCWIKNIRLLERELKKKLK